MAITAQFPSWFQKATGHAQEEKKGEKGEKGVRNLVVCFCMLGL
jgi:hypothetical protein